MKSETGKAKNFPRPTDEKMGRQSALDVSVVLPALNEAGNITPLLTELKEIFESLGLAYEVLLIDGGSTDDTRAEAERAGAFYMLQKRPGYGGALREGFEKARGEYVLTLDCDASHPPSLFKELWRHRSQADIIVASRFISGGDSKAPPHRRMLSVILNSLFGGLLIVPIKDLSSGYRLYRRAVLRPRDYRPENFNILQEILVRAYTDGFAVKEVPLQLQPRLAGESHASVLRFARSYLKSLYRLWILRHSPAAADYEDHAFDSRHILQRYWQRKRFSILSRLLEKEGRTLDIGCGSSRLTQSLNKVIALDTCRPKLRFLRKADNALKVQAAAERLPFCSQAFDHVVFSQVAPYISGCDFWKEISRVLKKHGTLLVGVPDCGRLSWKVIGFMYNHLLPNTDNKSVVSTFTRDELIDTLAEHGFRTLRTEYILGAELILKLSKIEEILPPEPVQYK